MTKRAKRVLVACEESQAVTKALRAHGIEAFSSDLLPCSGGHPEWHLQGDVVQFLAQGWDAVIAFPPCTDLASSGARWFAEKQAGGRQARSINFFTIFTMLYNVKHVAIENPVGIMSTKWRKPDQILQPWQFGHGETKATCLWLKGLPTLRPTEIVEGREQRVWKMGPAPDRAQKRSKTFEGVAQAMADQWAPIINAD